MTTHTARHLALLLALGLGLAASAQAQVTVKDAWVRATVAQQKATGAFMQITSSQDGKLVAVSTPLTAVAEVHEMAMQGNVMKMRAVQSLDLPAGKTVELKPGSYHLMLMDLKAPVKAGERVPLSLVIEDKAGKRQTVEVQAEVRSMVPPKQALHDHAGHDHHGDHKH